MRSTFQRFSPEWKNRTLRLHQQLDDTSNAGQLTATANEDIVVWGWLWHGVVPPRSGPLT